MDDEGTPARRRTAAGPDLPVGYGELLAQLNAEVRSARFRATRVVNTALLELYWTIGKAILDRQASEGWGARVITRLAGDLRTTAAAAWPGPIAQQAAAQLPWGHVMVLLDRTHRPERPGQIRASLRSACGAGPPCGPGRAAPSPA